MEAWMTVDHGKLIISAKGGGTAEIGGRSKARSILRVLRQLGITSAWCSSSVDFPQEYGAPRSLSQEIDEAFRLLHEGGDAQADRVLIRQGLTLGRMQGRLHAHRELCLTLARKYHARALD